MTGDGPDFVARLRAQLPRDWFPPVAPTLTALLSGFSAAWSDVFTRLGYVSAQARLRTVADGFLDLAARDYRGTRLLRRAAETDDNFRGRLLPILREKATRAAVIKAVTDLTGRAPTVFEPMLPTDAGGYGFLGMIAGTGLAYNVTGGWGSLALPLQCFVTAYRATGGGIAAVMGYYPGSGSAAGGYGVGAIEYGQLAFSQGQITDADIYAQITSVMPVASTGWAAITN